MVKRIGMGAALVAAAAVPIAAGSAGADGVHTSGGAAKSISCTVKLSKQRDPGPNGPGIDFAQITCSKPFGFGAQYDEFVLTPSGNPPSGDGSMKFKAFFDGGRVNGTWDVTFKATEKPCDFNFKIKSKFTGGTGRFRKVRGTGSGAGDFTDIENAPNCSKATVKYKMKVTGL